MTDPEKPPSVLLASGGVATQGEPAPVDIQQYVESSRAVSDFNESWGKDPLGPGKELTDLLTKNEATGLIGGLRDVGAAFNKSVTIPALKALDAATRTIGGLAHVGGAYTGGLTEDPFLGGSVNFEGAAAATKFSEAVTKAAQDTGGGNPLIPTLKLPDGTIKYGKPGTTHSDLIEGVPDKQLEKAEPGFAAEEGGPHMDRQQSVAWLNQNAPDIIQAIAKTSARYNAFGGRLGLEAEALNRVTVDPVKLGPQTVPIATELGIMPKAPDAPDVPPAMLAGDGKTFTMAPLSPADTAYAETKGALPTNELVDPAGKIETDGITDPQSAVNTVRDAAKEAGEFLGSRNGELPLAHTEAIADAGGRSPRDLDPPSIAENFRNSQEVARLGSLIKQSGQAMQDAARAIRGSSDFDGKKAFWRAAVQNLAIEEAVTGKVSEWGYTGHALNKLYEEGGPEEGVPPEPEPVIETARKLVEKQAKDILHKTVDDIDEGVLGGRSMQRITEQDGVREPWEFTEAKTPADTAEKIQSQFKLTMERAKAKNADDFKLKMEKATKARDKAGLKAWLDEPKEGKPSVAKFDTEVKDEESLKKFVRDTLKLTDRDVDAVPAHGRTINSPRQLSLFMKKRIPSPSKPLKVPEPATFWDKSVYWIKNAYLSGPYSHAMYAAGLTGFNIYENAVITPVAGMIGSMRRALKIGGAEGAHASEAIAAVHSIVSAVPAAVKSALVDGLWRNDRPLLPGQTEKENIRGYSQSTNPFGQSWAAKGVGLPMRVIGTIGQFYRDMGFASAMHKTAWRETIESGKTPFTPDFFNEYKNRLMHPSDDALAAGAVNGDYMHFVKPLGSVGRKLNAVARLPLVAPIIPFTTVPWNIYRIAIENSPAAWLGPEMRANLSGKNGGVAQDTALARMAVGSAVAAFTVHLALNGLITDNGPADPVAHAIWAKTHALNSGRIGNMWVDLRRFGPLGALMVGAASLANVGKWMAMAPQEANVRIKDAEYAEAAMRLAKDAGHIMETNLGMEGLDNVVDAITNPTGKKAASFISNFAASALPLSTMLAQSASMNDPWMRDTRSFLGPFRAHVPGHVFGVGRETLPMIRDWSGAPVANPGYRLGALIRQTPVAVDPINTELTVLHMKPAPLSREIEGLQMDDKQWVEYQSLAGVQTHAALTALVQSPDWYNTPAYLRERLFHSAITRARAQARQAIMLQPSFIQQSISNKLDQHFGTGVQAPEGLRLPPAQFEGLE